MDGVFDVNVLHTIAFESDGEFVRVEAVRYCRDPTFWSTVMQTGRIYDVERGDFSMAVREKYPGALDLFPATEEEAGRLLVAHPVMEDDHTL